MLSTGIIPDAVEFQKLIPLSNSSESVDTPMFSLERHRGAGYTPMYISFKSSN